MTYPLVKFGDVVRQVKDKVDPQTAGLERFVAGKHMDTDNLHIRRWGDVGDGYLGPAFHMRFKPGQVLYGSRRTYLRKVAVAEFEGITANTTYVIEPEPWRSTNSTKTRSCSRRRMGMSANTTNPCYCERTSLHRTQGGVRSNPLVNGNHPIERQQSFNRGLLRRESTVSQRHGTQGCIIGIEVSHAND